MNPTARLAACLAAVAWLPASLASATDLVTSGHSDYVIVLPKAPAPAEQRAANEVRSHLKQMTGADLSIAAATGDFPAHAILIGPTFIAKATDESLGEEGFVLKTEGDRIYLAGATPR